MVSAEEEEKERLRWEGFAEKEGFKVFCVQFQITKVSSHRRLFPHQSIRLR